MLGDIVCISAPLNVCRAGKANIEWDAMRLFQPLLGHDAQMAGFAAAARSSGVQVRVLTAPEIYCEGVSLDGLRAESGGRILAHVRFGSPRLPRVLKPSVNAVVLAEDTTIPTKIGRHPFSGGAALPSCVSTVMVYDQITPVPERIGAGPASLVVLPPDFANSDLQESADAALGDVNLQPCEGFNDAAWHRSEAPGEFQCAAEALARRTAILLPWNLAAPGSLVPDVLTKINHLAGQGRFPLTVVVLPYNDVPGSMATLARVTASCADHQTAYADGPMILLARARSIGASLALLQLCRRAWIDTTDPEWRWTLRRVTTCGLPVNFISGTFEHADIHDPGPYAPDELVTKQSDIRYAPLFWRTRVLSLRRLGQLSQAILRGVDVPFYPGPTDPLGSAAMPALQDLLRATGIGLDG